MPLASTRSKPSSGPTLGRANSRISIWRGPTCTAARTWSLIVTPSRVVVSGSLPAGDRHGGAGPVREDPHDHRDSRVARAGYGDEQVGGLGAREDALELTCRFAVAGQPQPVVALVLAGKRQLGGRPAAVLGQPGPHSGPVIAGVGQQLGMFGAEDDACRGVAEDPRSRAADRVREVAQQLLC